MLWFLSVQLWHWSQGLLCQNNTNFIRNYENCSMFVILRFSFFASLSVFLYLFLYIPPLNLWLSLSMHSSLNLFFPCFNVLYYLSYSYAWSISVCLSFIMSQQSLSILSIQISPCCACKWFFMIQPNSNSLELLRTFFGNIF